MATIGRLTLATGSEINIEGRIEGRPFTMSEDGTATSMTVSLRETSTDNTHTYRFGIFNNSTGALIAQTAVSASADVTQTRATKTLNFGGGVSLTNGTTYFMGAWCSGGSGGLAIAFDVGASGVGRADTSNGGTFPASDDPATLIDTTNDLGEMYITYTPSASGIAPRAQAHARRRRMM